MPQHTPHPKSSLVHCIVRLQYAPHFFIIRLQYAPHFFIIRLQYAPHFFNNSQALPFIILAPCPSLNV
jgi:hypothetical protein